MNFPVIPAQMPLINVAMQNCFVQDAPIGASAYFTFPRKALV